MFDYEIENRGTASLYEHLYRCIKRDIESGVIAAHQKLPSKRALAKRLGVSLVTVEAAFAQLVAEGYVYALERKGYYASSLDAAAQHPGSFAGLAEYAHMLARWDDAPGGAFVELGHAEPGHAVRAFARFDGGSTPPNTFPYQEWAKALRDAVVREPEDALLEQVHPMGAPQLREQIARRLREQRGMAVDASQVVVGAGAQVLYNLIVQLLGREVGYAVEDPGYPLLTKVYRANDVFVSHIPLDDEGVRLDALRASGASVLHAMPGHQYPTGQVTSIGRRYELLGWATSCEGRCIVEDDYDGEFRLAGKPIPSLQSIDAGSCVIHVGTLAKTMGPAFRLAYMVLPHRLAELFGERLGFYACTVSAVEQLALARFMESGAYQRHVNRMRSHYRSVRDALVAGLKSCRVGARLNVEETDAGLHFLMGVRTGVSDADLVAAATRRGVVLSPLAGYYQASQSENPRLSEGWFVMNYSGLRLEDVPLAVEAIARAVGETARA